MQSNTSNIQMFKTFSAPNLILVFWLSGYTLGKACIWC